MSTTSYAKKITSAIRAVAAAGTRVPLGVGDKDVSEVQSVTIKALPANGGNIYVGDFTVSAAAAYFVLEANETITYKVNISEWIRGYHIDIRTIWLDSAVNGEGVCYTTVRD